ncbi:DUF1684 domain-containing protein [Phytoactinopolyspora alkaliphila]|uniref:DUF1684 domain-containing protein n=1 Tax=Phytoactinopolyspora alkaliphila TaxID=1783498 RepID=UPI001C20979A
MRTAPSPAQGHATWIRERDTLFARHPASPIPPADRAVFTGLRYAPYDPALRFEVRVDPDVAPLRIDVTTGTDGVVPFDRIGRVRLPLGDLDVWWLGSYGGGLFLPLRDGSSGRRSYGGGRYVIDTVKGADLGGDPRRDLVVDLNFAYNPSCAYDPAWACPLAPPGNRLDTELHAGELASASTGASATEFLPDEEKSAPE